MSTLFEVVQGETSSSRRLGIGSAALRAAGEAERASRSGEFPTPGRYSADIALGADGGRGDGTRPVLLGAEAVPSRSGGSLGAPFAGLP